MDKLCVVENNEELKLDNLNLSKESLELMANELGKTPSLYTIVTTFYKYSIYKGLDYLHDNYNCELCSDSFMESVFLYLAKLGDEDKIEYFYKKNKNAIENRNSFDKFSIYKNQEIIEGSCEYSDYYFEPIFKEDKVLLEKYCSQFNKNKEVVEYLIKEVYKNDKEYINELKLKFPRQRKFQEFISNI